MAITERLAILIDANSGGAVSEFRKVGKEAEKLGQTTEQTGNIFDKAGQKFGVSGAALKAGVTTAAIAAGGALVKFGVDAAQSAAALNEQINGTNVTFGAASASVVEFGEKAAAALGLSQTEALQAANNFGAFFTNVGLGSEVSAELSTGLVQLSGDIASFKDVAGGAAEVADALRSGLSGESEPLRKFGVFLDEASTKSKALELGLGGVGRELTTGEKIVARYAQILDQTGKAQGDFARTSDSLANQQRILAAQQENLKASFGAGSAPVIAGFVSGLNDILRASTAASESIGGLARVQSAAGKASSAALGGPIAVATQFIRGLKDETDQAASKTQQFETAVRKYASIAGDAEAGTGALAAAKRELKTAATAAKAEQDELNATLVTDEEKSKKAAAAVKDLKQAVMGAQDAQRAHRSALESVRAAQLNVVAKQAELNRLLKEGAVDAKEVAAAERSLAAARRSTADAQERVVEAQKRIDELERGPSAEDQEQRAIDLAQARLDVADAEQDLTDTRQDSEASARDVERAELRLREAKLSLVRIESEQLDNSEDLARARKDLEAAERAVADASISEWDAAVKLNEARAGDPEHTAKITAARWDLMAAQEGVTTAQYNAERASIAYRDALDVERWKLVENADAVARLRTEYQELANLPIFAGMGQVPLAGQVTGTLGPGGVGRRASGGPVLSGQSYLVGERGPELLTMGAQGGYVTPNGGFGGSGATVINIHMPPGSDGDDVVAALRRYQQRNGSVPIRVGG